MQHLKIEVKVDGEIVREYETTISTPNSSFKEFWDFILQFQNDMRNWSVNNILENKK